MVAKHLRSGKKKGVLSNYCGPGGSGSTQHGTDQVCKEHDESEEYSKNTLSAYTHFNDADEKLLHDMKRVKISGPREGIINVASRAYFNVKKAIAPHSTKVSGKRNRSPGLSPSRKMPHRNERAVAIIPPEDEEMEEDAGEEPSLRSGNQLTTAGKDETPITIAPAIWGLQETHTAIFPLTVWFSINNITKATPQQFKFSAVNPYNPIISVINHITDPAGTWASHLGINDALMGYTDKFQGYFPASCTNSAQPAWLAFWSNLYTNYTTLSCKWKLIVNNPGAKTFGDVLINIGTDVWSASNNSDVRPIQPLSTTMQWRNNKFKLIEGSYLTGGGTSDRPQMEVLEAEYKPGDGRRMVVNDTDTKTWSTVGSNPALAEDIHFDFFNAPFCNDVNGKVNCQLELRYEVQFKDLIQAIEYPYVGQTATVKTFPNDILSKYA